MLVQTLIERKRDGGALQTAEWHELIARFLQGRIPDYQMSALLMAIVWRGLDDGELTALTEAMLESGSRLDWPGFDLPRVDKHSTGGVGDKVSLVLAPLVASCGVAVPMMSGRGLGHTGGTTDKLESMAGFRTDLTLDEVRAQVREIGVAMFGQSEAIAPADGRLYALRDVTGTVPSIPLIAASIISKKRAEGLDGLVLDVKTGSGAFMPDPDSARMLARTMVRLGEAGGCRTTAVITAMDRPLGRAIGNSLELEEALQALVGEGPADLRELTGRLAVEMLLLAKVADTEADAQLEVARALDKFRQLVEAQGGNPAVVDDPGSLPQATEVELYEASEDGVIGAVDPAPLGRAVVEMGGGRQRLGDAIDHSVGFVVTARPGMKVSAGQPVASVFARDAAGIEIGMQALRAAVRYGAADPPLPLVVGRVTSADLEQH